MVVVVVVVEVAEEVIAAVARVVVVFIAYKNLNFFKTAHSNSKVDETWGVGVLFEIDVGTFRPPGMSRSFLGH